MLRSLRLEGSKRPTDRQYSTMKKNKTKLVELSEEELTHRFQLNQVHRTMASLHEASHAASQVYDQIVHLTPRNRSSRQSEAALVQRAVNLQHHGQELLAILGVAKSLHELTRALYTPSQEDDKVAVQRLYKSVEVLAQFFQDLPEPEMSEQAAQDAVDFDLTEED